MYCANMLGAAFDVLFCSLWHFARIAAFEDNRFPPVVIDNFQSIDIKICILSALIPCIEPSDIEIGRHGLKIINGMNSVLLLPRAAEVNHWSRIEFLDQLCARAGLRTGAWRKQNISILRFEADFF